MIDSSARAKRPAGSSRGCIGARYCSGRRTAQMEQSGAGGDVERFRAAAEEARHELLRRLAEETDRLDRDLSELSVEMVNAARGAAEERLAELAASLRQELEARAEAATGAVERRL